jgi:hypothetical protein
MIMRHSCVTHPSARRRLACHAPTVVWSRLASHAREKAFVPTQFSSAVDTA